MDKSEYTDTLNTINTFDEKIVEPFHERVYKIFHKYLETYPHPENFEHHLNNYMWELVQFEDDYIYFKGSYDTGDCGRYMYDYATIQMPLDFLYNFKEDD